MSVTTWTDVINYVRTRSEVLEESDTWLRFRVEVSDTRTQQVSVQRVPQEDGSTWLVLSSPVGWAEQIDQARFLELAGSAPVGGAGVVDRVALLKHTVVLGEQGVVAEFATPLGLLVERADAFEHELTSADQF
ncbi:hypothetical protein LV78_002324 [Actinosynnema pretiosum]|nr:hypothetical protein [Actinosynnema pretiosum]